MFFLTAPCPGVGPEIAQRLKGRYLMFANIKVQYRNDYADTWKTITGPHPKGMALMENMRKLHREDPTKHLAVYIDDQLDFAWFPNTGFGEEPDVTVNGVTYKPISDQDGA